MRIGFKKIIALLLIPQVLILYYLKNNPRIVEEYYSEYIYQYIFKYYSILFSLLMYPVVGTPFVDHHSAFFSLLGIYSLILGIKTEKKLYLLYVKVN